MKAITIPKPFETAQGTPFRQGAKDKNGDFILKRDERNEIIRDGNGNILLEMVDATFPDVLKAFVNSVFNLARNEKKELSIEDAIVAKDIVRAANIVTDGVIELENSTHAWLIRNIASYGVKSLGLEAAVLQEVVNGAQDVVTTRAEHRREEKVKKG